MTQILKPYKGYIGQIDIDVNANLIYGRVIGLRDVISFDGMTVQEANESFHQSVDAYLEFCRENKVNPEKTFSGNLPFRTDPETHRLISAAAQIEGKSLNSWMRDVLAGAAQKTVDEAINHNEQFQQKTQQERRSDTSHRTTPSHAGVH